jgi:hypothetical protein
LQNISTSPQNLAKLEEKIIEVMRIESTEHVHMNDQQIELNGACRLGPKYNKYHLNTWYDVYKKSVYTTEVIAKVKQKESPQVSFQFVELGFLGYNQVATPISISNYNIEHKHEFEIFSNIHSDSFMTLSQGKNSFFERGERFLAS